MAKFVELNCGNLLFLNVENVTHITQYADGTIKAWLTTCSQESSSFNSDNGTLKQASVNLTPTSLEKLKSQII